MPQDQLHSSPIESMPQPWEMLSQVIFDMKLCQITLVSEEGFTKAIPCDDLLELHSLAKLSLAIGQGSNVNFSWRMP